MKPSYRFSRAVLAFIARLLFRLETHGLGNVPASGPVLITANHGSNLDPPLMSICSPRQCHFLSKAELFKIPLLGTFVWHVGNVRPIQRGRMDRAAIRTAHEIFARGGALVVFPEGTRTHTGDLQEPKTGVALLLQPGTLILPVYIDGSFRALPRGRIFPRLTKIRVYFGEPFDPYTVSDAVRPDHRKAILEAMERIAELREKALAAH